MTLLRQVRGIVGLVRYANRVGFLSAVDPYRLRQVEVLAFDSAGLADRGVEAGYAMGAILAGPGRVLSGTSIGNMGKRAEGNT